MNLCPNCDSDKMLFFYEINSIPVHSVLLLSTRDKAINYKKGNIKLGFCLVCGGISNVTFDSSLLEYSTGYESTQGFSSTFNDFSMKLAINLIERYKLYNKDIIEIGCGQGEFLTLLCDIGGNNGIGFDPTYNIENDENSVNDNKYIIKDFYSEKYANIHCDFICCKMTLEHIYNPRDFIQIIRRSIQNRPDTIIFFQVPNIIPILRNLAFWDIYYEHCSYFSPDSLARLFRQNGFEVIDLWKDFDEQYIMLGAKLESGKKLHSLSLDDDLTELKEHIEFFSENYKCKIYNWKRNLKYFRDWGRRVVLWGGGSKAVAFLTTLNIKNEIKYIVDINPNKIGTYMAGSGQKIVAPEFLEQNKPDIVIVMNPIYLNEIQENLQRMGINAKLMSV